MEKFQLKVDDDIYLLPWKLENTQELYNLVDKNRAYLNNWLPWVPASKTLKDTEEFIKGALEQYKNGSGLELGIWYKRKIAGAIGLHAISKMHNKTSIGYWLAQDFQGKGIMTKAVATLTNYCFEKLNMNRVEIKVAVGNEKSNAVPTRLGFVKEGVLREAEKLEKGYVDWNFYAVLKRDWKFPTPTGNRNQKE